MTSRDPATFWLSSLFWQSPFGLSMQFTEVANDGTRAPTHTERIRTAFASK